jgi:hypothetical protein
VPTAQGGARWLTIDEYTLVAKPIVEFGYLTVTVDMSKKTATCTIRFNDRTNTRVHDRVKLNLTQGKILKNA